MWSNRAWPRLSCGSKQMMRRRSREEGGGREGVDRERGNRTRERVTKNLLSHVCLCGNR